MLFFLSLFFLLWPIKHKAGHVAYILIKLSYLVPCYYSLLLESGINCTQWSHRREKSLRINIDSGMHLFAGFISEEEGFPQENEGSPGVPALERQPWGRMSFWGPATTVGSPQPHPAGVFHGHPQRETCPVAVAAPAVLGRWGSSSSCLSDNPKPWSQGSLWRLGVPRPAPGHTRSPAGGARSARAAGPGCWGRSCSPRAQT